MLQTAHSKVHHNTKQKEKQASTDTVARFINSPERAERRDHCSATILTIRSLRSAYGNDLPLPWHSILLPNTAPTRRHRARGHGRRTGEQPQNTKKLNRKPQPRLQPQHHKTRTNAKPQNRTADHSCKTITPTHNPQPAESTTNQDHNSTRHPTNNTNHEAEKRQLSLPSFFRGPA